MRQALPKLIAMLIAMGFILPSLVGVLWPVFSASKWQIELINQASIDQYRTLSLLILAFGLLIMWGALRPSSLPVSLMSCCVLLSALLLGRVWSFAFGDVLVNH